jgi:hypothetical protein
MNESWHDDHEQLQIVPGFKNITMRTNDVQTLTFEELK